jgi:hypothetical protein
LNKMKCMECVFHLRGNTSANDVNPPASIDGQPFRRVDTVKYLGVYFSSDGSWSVHVDNLFAKCLKLTFVIKRLTKLHVPHAILRTFVDHCILPIILYCSPVIFCGLLAKDILKIRRALKLLSRASGIEYDTLVTQVADRHLTSSTKFARSILSDDKHPLFPYLSISISNSGTRNSFNLIYCRTSSFRKSIIPFLARVLVNNANELNTFTRLFY